MRGLLDMAGQCNAEVKGIGIAIEKGFQKGGEILRSEGYNLKSLAIIDDMKDGKITFRDE
ncbi:Xanthine phosphoribosyltransferase [bioreactor metagenome]